jgi:hypothetical protein
MLRNICRTQAFVTCFVALAMMLLFANGSARAQLVGAGEISGTITDSSGAVVAGAAISAVETETGSKYDTTSSRTGSYVISPVAVGIYSVTVTAAGFETFTQQNVVVDVSSTVGLNLSLKVGSTTQTVTVSETPIELDTQDATLGGTIDQRSVESIPLLMNGSQRMITDLSWLFAGVQQSTKTQAPGYTSTSSNDNTGVVNGSGPGGTVTEIYLDGIPMSGGDGDSRNVWIAFAADTVSQVKIQTSAYPADEQGMGVENYQIKSGTKEWHGSVFDFLRNTAFDTWGFTQPAATKLNSLGQTVPAGKPAEHQNEFGLTIGGPIFRFVPQWTGLSRWKDKVFFFGDYGGYREAVSVTPLYEQVPNLAELQGNFSELLAPGGLGYQLYDPASQTCTTPGNPSTCSRTAIPNDNFANMPGGTARISSISQAMLNLGMTQLAAQANQSTPIGSNNILLTTNSGNSNWSTVEHFDFDLSDRHKISVIYGQGRAASTGIPSNSNQQAPPPYTNSHPSLTHTKALILEDTYTFSPRVVNELKYGIDTWWDLDANFSDAPNYAASALGITGLPTGQAAGAFPQVEFGGKTGAFPNEWAGQTGYLTVSRDFSLVDSVVYSRGRHSFTFGAQAQWLEATLDDPLTGSTPLSLNFASAETAALAGNGQTANTGFAFASYLLGAVDSASFSDQTVLSAGLRLHNLAPYVQDDIKVNPKLTLNLGLRWDIDDPFSENHNQFSFFNPRGTNPYSGYPGSLEFAGSGSGGEYCNCSTPLEKYWHNWGPRIGFAYSADSKTVVRGAYSIYYSRNNNTGTGTGQSTFLSGNGILGYSVAPSYSNNNTTTYPGLPAFWLAPNGPSTTPSGGSEAGAAIPAYNFPPVINSAAAGLGTYYSNILPAGSTGSSMNYPDPHLGGLSLKYINYNFGIERALYKDLIVSVNYVGNLGSNLVLSGARGYYNNSSPLQYLALGPIPTTTNAKASILTQPVSNSAALATAQAMFPGLTVDPTFPTSQTIEQLTRPFPQYSKISDTYEALGTTNYNALQLTFAKRAPFHGLTWNLNYTWDKAMDDVENYRNGYEPLRAEWSPSQTDIPNYLTVYAVYDLPAGRGHLVGGDNPFLDAIVGGWRTTGVFFYSSGYALQVTTSGCNTGDTGGTCIPNLTPGYSGSPRVHGGYGSHVTAATLGTTQYLDPTAFTTPSTFTFGNAPTTAPYHLYGPGDHDLDLSVRREFPIMPEGKAKFIFRMDVFNVPNNVIFGGLTTSLTAKANTQQNTPIITYAPSTTASFGTFTSQANHQRDIQFAGRIEF